VLRGGEINHPTPSQRRRRCIKVPNLTPTGGRENVRRTHPVGGVRALAIGCISLLVWVVVSALWSSSAGAAPAAPVEVTLEQPGGKTFAAKPWGDEWTNGFETTKGFTVVRSRESGAWEYAVEGPEGGLKASGEKAALEDPPSGIEKHLRPEEDAPDVLQSQRASELRSPALASPNTGTQTSLVLLVKFSNQAPLGSRPAQWRARFFGSANSIRDYYGEVSYGKLNIAPAAEGHGTANDGVVGWLALNRNHPNTAGNTGTANRLLTRDAVRAADRYVNFKAYDKDRDGHLSTKELHVSVVVAGQDASAGRGSGRSVWAHQWSLFGSEQPTVDGVVVGDWARGGGYTQFGEWHGDHMATIGIIAHEIGHDLNLPDLYDTDLSSEGIGEWSVMATGCSPTRAASTGPGSNLREMASTSWSRTASAWATTRPCQVPGFSCGILTRPAPRVTTPTTTRIASSST